jgi:TusA-related sulfurtransferase
MSEDREFLEFDIRGQICPSSLLVALRELNRHRDGLCSGVKGLRFLTDNRDATQTIPESATNMGFSAQVEKRDTFYAITVQG